jgi:hypothetical protein
MTDKDEICREFYTEFSRFGATFLTVLKMVKTTTSQFTELTSLFEKSTHTAVVSVFDDCKNKMETPPGKEAVLLLLRELKFHNGFYWDSVQPELRIKKFVDAGIIILESISKFFNGSVVGIFSDISIETLKLINCLYL